ncbi:MAG TPA: class I SAM-dependent methyltransferase [Sneathiellales bacterium]|nr:class I SAM-dependent methyltransferase [Sneathiellales bacterium]
MDDIYEFVVNRFSSSSNVCIHRTQSEEMRYLFAESQFDWIYIDGDHGLGGVLSDLETSWRLVKPGGMIAVDDYYWKESDHSLSVKIGIQKFVERKNISQSWIIGDQFLFRRE